MEAVPPLDAGESAGEIRIAVLGFRSVETEVVEPSPASMRGSLQAMRTSAAAGGEESPTEPRTKAHTEFEIELTSAAGRWTQWRRWSEIQAFHSRLKTLNVSLEKVSRYKVSLPRKAWGSKKDEAESKNRHNELVIFFAGMAAWVTALQEASPDPVNLFKYSYVTEFFTGETEDTLTAGGAVLAGALEVIPPTEPEPAGEAGGASPSVSRRSLQLHDALPSLSPPEADPRDNLVSQQSQQLALQRGQRVESLQQALADKTEEFTMMEEFNADLESQLGAAKERLAVEEQSGTTTGQELIRVSSEDGKANNAGRAEAAEARVAGLEAELVAERQARVQAELAAAANRSAAPAAGAPATEDAAVLVGALAAAEAAAKDKEQQLQMMEEMMTETQTENDSQLQELSGQIQQLTAQVAAAGGGAKWGKDKMCAEMTTAEREALAVLGLTQQAWDEPTAGEQTVYDRSWADLKELTWDLKELSAEQQVAAPALGMIAPEFTDKQPGSMGSLEPEMPAPVPRDLLLVRFYT